MCWDESRGCDTSRLRERRGGGGVPLDVFPRDRVNARVVAKERANGLLVNCSRNSGLK